MSGSQSSLREANRALIVETIKRHGGLTQVELAAATGLSAATVSTIVKELLGGGFVDIHVTTRSGRRAQLVTLARRVGLAAGTAARFWAFRKFVFLHPVTAARRRELQRARLPARTTVREPGQGEAR